MLFRGLVASAILLCQTHRAFDVPFSMAVQPVLPHDCSFCANSVHTQTPSFAVQCLSLQDALYIMLTVSHNCLSFVRFFVLSLDLQREPKQRLGAGSAAATVCACSCLWLPAWGI